jgi:hypothetical protein
MGTSMKLSTESNSAQGTSERRRRERVAGETAGWIFPPNMQLARHGPAEEQGWEVLVNDVSRFGVGFTSMQPLEPGSTHKLRIGRGPLHRSRLVRVIVCRQDAHGYYAIGAEFLDTGHRPMAKAG